MLTDGRTDRPTDRPTTRHGNRPSGPKNVKILTFDLQETTLRVIQPNPTYDMLFMSSQRSFMQKKKKSY